jgi:hypothetical protein
VSDPTQCPTCGSPLQADAKFCGTCGTETAPNPVVPPPDAGPSTTGPADAPTDAAPPSDPWAPSTAGTEDDLDEDDDPPLLAPGAAPPPGGWGAPTPGVGGALPPTVAGGTGVIGGAALGATTAQPPVGAPPGLPPTIADQAMASAGEGPYSGGGTGGTGGPPPGGGDGTGEVPHWMPDPSKEQQSSRTGIFVVLGVAAGVLITLILLAIVLIANSGDDDDVSSDATTTSTTEAETTTTTEQATTTTTEQETTTTTEATTTTSTTTAPPPSALAVGDCITNDPTGDTLELSTETVVDCGDPHRGELFFAISGSGAYPTGADRTELFQQCIGDPFEDYVGVAYQSSAIYATGVIPDESEWDEGDTTVWCVAHEQDGSETTGSYRNSNR